MICLSSRRQVNTRLHSAVITLTRCHFSAASFSRASTAQLYSITEEKMSQEQVHTDPSCKWEQLRRYRRGPWSANGHREARMVTIKVFLQDNMPDQNGSFSSSASAAEPNNGSNPGSNQHRFLFKEWRIWAGYIVLCGLTEMVVQHRHHHHHLNLAGPNCDSRCQKERGQTCYECGDEKWLPLQGMQ